MKKNELRSNNKGFSLVELIVVIAIMAALVAIIAPQFMKFVGQSKTSADAQQIEEIQTTLKTIAIDLPAGTYTVAVPFVSDTDTTVTVVNADEDAQKKANDLFKEYAGDNWGTTARVKSDTYEDGVTITMIIADNYKTTINYAAN